MKVLGTANKDYILQASSDEVAQLMGYRDSYRACGDRKMPKTGDEVVISELFERFYSLLQLNSEFHLASQHCKTIADALSLVAPVVCVIRDETKDIEVK